MRILTLNVSGLKSKLSISDYVDTCLKYDVLCFSQIKCDEVDMQCIKDFFDNLGYTVIYRVRKTLSVNKSGGILIGVKNSIKSFWKPLIGRSEVSISVMIDKSFLGLPKHIIISVVYIPPSNSRYSSVKMFDHLDNFLLDHNNEDYCHILCGDFNAHTGGFTDVLQSSEYFVGDDDFMNITDVNNIMLHLGMPETRYSKDISAVNAFGKKLLELCKTNRVCIYNGRVGSDCLIGKANYSIKYCS